MAESTKSESVRWTLERRSQLSPEKIHERFEELVRRRWTSTGAGPGEPLADVFASETSVVVEIELPGIAAENVSAQLSEGVLVIEARRPPSPDGMRALHLERQRGSVHRRIPIPELHGPIELELSSCNGVLTVVIRPETRK